MRAPLIERECILDIFCFLFVNNFYFRLLPGVPSSSALGPEALAIEPAPVRSHIWLQAVEEGIVHSRPAQGAARALSQSRHRGL